MGKGKGKGCGKGRDNEDSPLGCVIFVVIMFIVYGSIGVAKKPYMDFDNDAVSTWESATCTVNYKILKHIRTDGKNEVTGGGGARRLLADELEFDSTIGQEGGELEVKEETRRRLRSTGGSNNKNKNHYVVKLHVSVNPDDLGKTGYNATALKWPSWTMSPKYFGKTEADQSFNDKTGAQAWRHKYIRGNTYRWCLLARASCMILAQSNPPSLPPNPFQPLLGSFVHPDHPAKVAMKNVGAIWCESTYWWGVGLLLVGMSPFICMFLAGTWFCFLSPCVHAGIEKAHEAGLEPPNSMPTAVDRRMHSLHRAASRSGDRLQMRVQNVKRMVSSGSLSLPENTEDKPEAAHSKEDEGIVALLEELKTVTTRADAEAKYKQMRAYYETISKSELKEDSRINKYTVFKPVNDAVKTAIGTVNFNAFCKPHFDMIMQIIRVAHSETTSTELASTVTSAIAADGV